VGFDPGLTPRGFQRSELKHDELLSNFTCFGFKCNLRPCTVVFASQLSQVALDAHMALLNVTGLTFMSGPMAFGIAANVRVGNLLGAGHPAAARIAGIVSVAAGAAWMACCGVLIVAFRREVGYAFVGDDEEVVNLVARIAPFAAIFQVFDGILGTCNGVLRACGRQSLLAMVNLGGLWGIGVSSGVIITFAMHQVGRCRLTPGLHA